jgi:hypothetical protein
MTTTSASKYTRAIVTCEQDFSDVTVTTTTDGRLALVIEGNAEQRGRRYYRTMNLDAATAVAEALAMCSEHKAQP